MKYEIGFLGTGSMGGALARAAARAMAEKVIVANRSRGKAEAIANETGCACGDFLEAARQSRYIVLGVLPGAVREVVEAIRPALDEERHVLVSIASGVSLAQLKDWAGANTGVIRIMPNTPVAVGKGLIFLAADESATAEETATLTELLGCAGAVEPLEESLFNAGSAVAGCGPAFAAMFVDALADGGVKAGLPRAKAIRFAEQMVLGTAALALETGKHPDQLRDEVCSPGGSTIEGVQALEEGGFRAAVMRAVVAAWKKHG